MKACHSGGGPLRRRGGVGGLRPPGGPARPLGGELADPMTRNAPADEGKAGEAGRPVVFTVFTATYNRAHTLPRLYQALQAQTFRDFEWLIVDDGSTDETPELVAHWQREGKLAIRYVRQEHAHKKTAFNRGVALARGELFLALDSDDACVPQALERFWFHWQSIPENRRQDFSAVTCLCQDEEGRIVGDPFPAPVVDSDSLEMRHRYRVRGEKWGFHRTDVLRRFPFPEDLSGYVPEDVVWMAIAREFKTRYVNEPLRIYRVAAPPGEEQISHALDWRAMAPGHVVWMVSILTVEWPYFRSNPRRFLWAAATLTRFRLHGGRPPRGWWRRLPGGARPLVVALAPAGVVLWVRDRLVRAKRQLARRRSPGSGSMGA